MSVEVKVKVDTPPKRMQHEAVRRKSVLERLQEAMNNIDSGSEFVEDDWCFVMKVKKELQSRRQLPEKLQFILDKVELFCYKYDKGDEPKTEGKE